MQFLDKLSREARGLTELVRARVSPPFTTFCLVGHGTGWVLDHEAREIGQIVRSLGVPVRQVTRRFGLPTNQCIHFTGAGILNEPETMETCPRFSFDYYHGRPGQDPMFTQRFENLRKFADRITKVRVSNSLMEKVALEAGVPRERLHRITIGINPDWFQAATSQSRTEVRRLLNLEDGAFVVGSFQKDGVGWGEGMEPKWEKAPDIFADAVIAAAKKVPNLTVLLTGPSRGYLKERLTKAGVPFRHDFVSDYKEIGRRFHALDAYLISSREEGGPKAILESMATGVPLVSTRAGQAVDLVRPGENGFLAEVDDAEALAEHLVRVASLSALELESLKQAGLATAAGHTYRSQTQQWRAFLDNYVQFTR